MMATMAEIPTLGACYPIDVITHPSVRGFRCFE
jgi:hypothetical protein